MVAMASQPFKKSLHASCESNNITGGSPLRSWYLMAKAMAEASAFVAEVVHGEALVRSLMLLSTTVTR